MHHIFAGVTDAGQVWGWGYGGEGQLGLGSRIKMVSSPHLIPCLDQSSSGKDRPLVSHHGSVNSSVAVPKEAGCRVKAIACGGRHSAVITGQTQSSYIFFWVSGHKVSLTLSHYLERGTYYSFYSCVSFSVQEGQSLDCCGPY